MRQRSGRDGLAGLAPSVPNLRIRLSTAASLCMVTKRGGVKVRAVSFFATGARARRRPRRKEGVVGVATAGPLSCRLVSGQLAGAAHEACLDLFRQVPRVGL